MRARRAEDQIQLAVFAHFRQRAAPGVFAFHPANGGYRKRVEAAILKGLGVVAGVPDVIAIKDGRTYALELKAPKGKISDAQNCVHEAMLDAGVAVSVAYGIDQAIHILENWGLLRGAAAIVKADDYDPAKDVEGSFNDAYAAVRERVAQGGEPWVPK